MERKQLYSIIGTVFSITFILINLITFGNYISIPITMVGIPGNEFTLGSWFLSNPIILWLCFVGILVLFLSVLIYLIKSKKNLEITDN